MIRRDPRRVRRIPVWDGGAGVRFEPSAPERPSRMPWWPAVVACLALFVWWRVRPEAGVEIRPSRQVATAVAVELPPTPKVEALPDEIVPVPTTDPVVASDAVSAQAPSVGLVEVGSAGGSGNGPGLDLGLEGGSGLAVAAGGGGTGHGVGTGTGNGVGSERMVYQLGQVDQDAGVDRIVDPPFPRRAKEDGVQANLELRILVDERGRVEKLEVLGAPPGYGFETAVQNASRNWRFRPAQLGGVPVPQWVRMPYNFRLE